MTHDAIHDCRTQLQQLVEKWAPSGWPGDGDIIGTWPAPEENARMF